MPSAQKQLNTAVYKSSRNECSQRDVGVCFSGGGSRALSAAMGQLRGLSQTLSEGEAPWMEQVHTISSVSGGCWASSLYIFLPASISYSDFLNSPASPSQLTWDAGKTPESLSYLPENNLGWVPTRLGPEAIIKQVEGFLEHSFDDSHQWWRAALGDLIFKGFGLYETDEAFNPTKFYGWQASHFLSDIQPYNEGLTKDDFHFARNTWPQLVMNTAMFYPNSEKEEELVPVLSTLLDAGVLASFPLPNQQGVVAGDSAAGDPVAGGGTIQPFAMGASLEEKQKQRASVEQSRPFSIADIASLSSAAFAALFETHHLIKDLVPQYQYWPVAGDSSGSQVFNFADGGNIENSGLVNMLATTSLTKIVVFINSEEAVEHKWETAHHTQIPATIPPLFGFQPVDVFLDRDGYKPYEGDDAPNIPLQKHNQVFQRSAFQALLDGLRDSSNSFENTAMYYQEGLEVQDNAWFKVTGNRKVDVLWVCNNKVKSWERAIQDSEIKEALELRHIPESRLWNFPYYGTIEQLHLSKQQVNMLAHLSCWNVVAPENLSTWKKLFSG